MRILAVLAMALGLTGCFSSDHPLFDAERGSCPFATATIYDEVDPNASGPPNRFVFETEGQYCKVTDPDGDVSRSLFVPAGRGWWIVQGDEARPSYGLVRRNGARLTQYLPQCKDFSAARLTRLGVTFDEDRRECAVNDAHQVEILFRAWRSPFRRPSGAFREVEAGS